MRLSIVIPAFNEEARLGRMLDAYLPFFDGHYGSDYEIIIVVNGSRDRTEQIADGYAESNPCVKVVVEPQSIGKGGAIMLGLERACGELIGFTDADGSTPPEAFQALVEKINNAGAIIASRWCKGAIVIPRQPLSRIIASRLFNIIVRIMFGKHFGLHISDTQCGAKLMSREALKAVLPCLGLTRWAFDVELLFQLRCAGYRIIEIPTVWHDVSGSRVKIVRASVEMLVALIRLRLLYSPFRWIVSVYDCTLGRFFRPWE